MLNEMVKDKNMSLEDMYNIVLEKDIGNIDNVNNRETIEMYIVDMMRRDVRVSHILKALENNRDVDIFKIWLGNSMETPSPIRSKQDLFDALV